MGKAAAGSAPALCPWVVVGWKRSGSPELSLYRRETLLPLNSLKDAAELRAKPLLSSSPLSMGKAWRGAEAYSKEMLILPGPCRARTMGHRAGVGRSCGTGTPIP